MAAAYRSLLRRPSRLPPYPAQPGRVCIDMQGRPWRAECASTCKDGFCGPSTCEDMPVPRLTKKRKAASGTAATSQSSMPEQPSTGPGKSAGQALAKREGARQGRAQGKRSPRKSAGQALAKEERAIPRPACGWSPLAVRRRAAAEAAAGVGGRGEGGGGGGRQLRTYLGPKAAARVPALWNPLGPSLLVRRD